MDGMYGQSGSADYPPDRVTSTLIIPPDHNLMSSIGNYQPLMNHYTSSSMKDTYSFHHQQQHYQNYCYNHSHQQQHNRLPAFGSDELISVASAISEAASISTHDKHQDDVDDDAAVLTAIKQKIASHPRYPRLLRAYIDCQKVGATPEISYLLDEIRREHDKEDGNSSCLGADPELDEFMDTYCDVLTKYKSDLSRPFEEATDFLNQIEMQFTNICKGAYARSTSVSSSFLPDDTTSDEEYSDEVEIQELQPRDDGRELKDRLLNRFGSHLGSLKMEFSKKKKKGKLPRDARQTLLDWWNSHYKWPYPTEGDKIALAERTGLDPRQINNWFINQRKRHWKPSESMQFAAYMEEHLFPDDG